MGGFSSGLQELFPARLSEVPPGTAWRKERGHYLKTCCTSKHAGPGQIYEWQSAHGNQGLTSGKDTHMGYRRRDLIVRTPGGTPPVAGIPPGHISYVTDQMNRIKTMPARLLNPAGASRGYIPDGHRRNWDLSYIRHCVTRTAWRKERGHYLKTCCTSKHAGPGQIYEWQSAHGNQGLTSGKDIIWVTGYGWQYGFKLRKMSSSDGRR
ncbi:hypothetical protein Bbelb_114920 [Branchiostoma belcheri]|nr:hypothetical protein Bbelb_114920 [Branchiostoma belcheri]